MSNYFSYHFIVIADFMMSLKHVIYEQEKITEY